MIEINLNQKCYLIMLDRIEKKNIYKFINGI